MRFKRSIILILQLTVIGILSGGCSEPLTLWPLFGETERVAVEHQFLGTSVEKRPIECMILGNGDDVVLILATIHGDEPAGTKLVYKLSEHIQKNPHLLEERKVLLVPIVNPDGMKNFTRSNARGIDLNRNFSTKNRVNNLISGQTPLSEPESQILEELILEYKPNRIISIHQPFGCIDYDGPAEDLANMIAARTDLPVEKLGAKAGSLGSFTGVDLGIPTITLELKADDHHLNKKKLWQLYGQSLIQSVVYPNTIEQMGK
jgi:protein MpaA